MAGVFGEIVCVIVEESKLDWIHLTWSVKRVLFADNRTVVFLACVDWLFGCTITHARSQERG